ncbi:hypothetical protein OG780_07345 [Streptomyces sp. NBC_00386]|uniref:hypothetical protein n=1 Tax=Streptomyces sp. NBC_00386 TaxID=2975734 RepID=UPI002E1C88A9
MGGRGRTAHLRGRSGLGGSTRVLDTAFWFNDLVETTSEGEFVRQFLVTASEPTKVETAEFTLRHGLCAPAPSSENLLMLDFAEGWTTTGDLAERPSRETAVNTARRG